MNQTGVSGKEFGNVQRHGKGSRKGRPIKVTTLLMGTKGRVGLTTAARNASHVGIGDSRLNAIATVLAMVDLLTPLVKLVLRRTTLIEKARETATTFRHGRVSTASSELHKLIVYCVMHKQGGGTFKGHHRVDLKAGYGSNRPKQMGRIHDHVASIGPAHGVGNLWGYEGMLSRYFGDNGLQKSNIVHILFQGIATTILGIKTRLYSFGNGKHKLIGFSHVYPMHHGCGSTTQTMNGKHEGQNIRICFGMVVASRRGNVQDVFSLAILPTIVARHGQLSKEFFTTNQLLLVIVCIDSTSLWLDYSD
jgi:hypothetical protein